MSNFSNYETANCCVATLQSLLLHETVLIQGAVELMISWAVSVTLLLLCALHHYLARSLTEMQTKAIVLFLNLTGTTFVRKKHYHGLPLKNERQGKQRGKLGQLPVSTPSIVCERMPRWRPAVLEALQNACSVPRHPHGGRMETYISLKATVVTSLSHHSHACWACVKARHK